MNKNVLFGIIIGLLFCAGVYSLIKSKLSTFDKTIKVYYFNGESESIIIELNEVNNSVWLTNRNCISSGNRIFACNVRRFEIVK